MMFYVVCLSVGWQTTYFGKLDAVVSLPNSIRSTPRQSDNEQEDPDEAPDSDEERQQLSKRISPASKIDISSMEPCTTAVIRVPVK